MVCQIETGDEFTGCQARELLARLRAAIARWSKSDEGSEALADAAGDFNVGDLVNYTPAGLGRHGELSRCLTGTGITFLNVEVYSQGYVMPGWDFDTHLASAPGE